MKDRDITTFVTAALCLVAFCAIAVLFKVVPLGELPATFIGAALGAVITGVVTVILLQGQSKAQEVKERNVKIFEKKAAVFQRYIDTVWKIWTDRKVAAQEFEKLTTGYYKDVMLYLDDKKLYEGKTPSKIIADCISKIGNHLDKAATGSVVKELQGNIALIINVLSDQIGLGGKIDIKIIEEHDKQMFPVMFRRAILEAFNDKLVRPNAKLLYEGYWDEWEENDNLIWDMMEFRLKKNPDCSMMFGYSMNYNYLPQTRQFEGIMYLPRGAKYDAIRQRGKERADLQIDKGKLISQWKPPIEFFCFYDESDKGIEAIREKGAYLKISRDLAERATEFFASAKVADTGDTIANYVEKQFGGEK